MQVIHYNELIAQINQDIAKKGELSSLMDFEDVKRLNIYSTAYEESLAEEEIKEMHERREIPVRPEFEGNALVRGVKGLIRKLITATVIPMQLEQNVWNNKVVDFSKICFGLDAPIKTLVIPSWASTHASAVCASVSPLSHATLSSFLIFSLSSSDRLVSLR